VATPPHDRPAVAPATPFGYVAVGSTGPWAWRFRLHPASHVFAASHGCVIARKQSKAGPKGTRKLGNSGDPPILADLFETDRCLIEKHRQL
jgi:hypothetical protein